LLSASNDSTIKIWDLRQGHILYTLYGHEGASTAVNFSPCGDYFCSAGIDSVVMVWKSNLNEQESELIEDIGNITSAGGIAPSPGLNGGITSNRKSKAQPVAG
jgi:WD40 repeat protein